MEFSGRLMLEISWKVMELKEFVAPFVKGFFSMASHLTGADSAHF